MANKKIAITVVIVVALAVIAAMAVKISKRPSSKAPASQAGQQGSQPMKVVQTDVPVTKTPDSFPVNIPMEKDAKITQNYNAKAENGLYQATRVFESVKSLDENFKIYSDYINSNGWKLVSSLNQENLKALAAQKDKGNLQVTLNENSQTHIKTVSVTYSEQR